MTSDHKNLTYLHGLRRRRPRVQSPGRPTRHLLLDLLFQRDGRTLTDLQSGVAMTRFGVMKHLRVLEGAGVIVVKRSGREKLHFLNPLPIRLIHDRWIDKYTARHVAALTTLKTRSKKQP